MHALLHLVGIKLNSDHIDAHTHLLQGVFGKGALPARTSLKDRCTFLPPYGTILRGRTPPRPGPGVETVSWPSVGAVGRRLGG